MSANTNTSGTDLLGLLSVLFIALKLTGYIDWTWWAVLSPIWVPATLIIIFHALVGLIILVKAMKGSGRR